MLDEKLGPIVSDAIAWRRRIHANPETAFTEFQTADFVAACLSGWGVEVHRGLAVTGVVGVLKRGNSGSSMGLRADMDALHLTEDNSFDHKSKVPGKMHGCGHDGHVAMLLGAAQYLAQEGQFDGTIYFIFQPAEENEAGGRRMVDEGLFTKFPMQAVFGLHNMPSVPFGKLALRAGPIMASADFFKIVVRGKGGHGAWPHNATDVISIASEIVLAFNKVVARTIDPLESAVISVTKIHGGDTTNVIPNEVVLEGTTRAFSPQTREHLEQSMGSVCDGLGQIAGADITFLYDKRYPATINHKVETDFAIRIAKRAFGDRNVLSDLPPVMGAEDFGWMLQEKQGCYAWLGTGTENAAMLHSSRYDFNDDIMATGVRYWIVLAQAWLRTQ